MSHTVAYNSEAHIVETKVYGILSLVEAKELISAIGRACLENNCFSCLSDYREATLSLSTLEIYEVPKTLETILNSQGLPAYKIRRAIVVAKGLKDFHFYETVTLNSWQRIKLFQDINDAKKWLLKE